VINGGVVSDGTGEGKALAQCDGVGQTCAGAGASAGSLCAYGEGSLWIFDAEFEICAGWGVAAEASFTHLLATTVDSGYAQVISHFADTVTYGEPQRRCERAGYVHDAVQESCEYTQEKVVTKVEPKTARGTCSEIHRTAITTDPWLLVSQLNQMNGCKTSKTASSNALCYEAEAQATAKAEPFSSSVPPVTATNCDSENMDGALSLLDISGDDDDDPVAILLRDLSPGDQDAMREAIVSAVKSHVAHLRAGYVGSPVAMRNLMEGVFAEMIDSVSESVNAADFTVWVVAA
jgi:hypothetical protein